MVDTFILLENKNILCWIDFEKSPHTNLPHVPSSPLFPYVFVQFQVPDTVYLDSSHCLMQSKPK